MNPLQQMQNTFLEFDRGQRLDGGKNSRKRQSDDGIQQMAKRAAMNRVENRHSVTPPLIFPGPPLYNSTPNFQLPGPSPPGAANNFFSPMSTFQPFPPPPMFLNDSFPFPPSVIGTPSFSQLPSCSFKNSSDDSGIQSDASLLTAADRSSFNGTKDDDGEMENVEPTETKIVFTLPQANERKLVRDDVLFAEVSGRLCVLAQATKYKVTVGEIRRRINPPECLHASLINGILRKAKAKDGNKSLRQDLAKVGLILPSGRRKTTPSTAFSALCEEESVALAQDFVKLSENDFPTSVLAQDYLAYSSSLPYGLIRTKQELETVWFFLSRMNQVLSSVGTHPQEYPPSTPRPYDFVNGRVSDAVNNFSLLTHGFGHNAFGGVVQTLMRVAKEGLQQIDHFQQSTSLAPN